MCHRILVVYMCDAMKKIENSCHKKDKEKGGGGGGRRGEEGEEEVEREGEKERIPKEKSSKKKGRENMK